jgi:hypothetical protein
MKKIILLLSISISAWATNKPVEHLITVNAEIAKLAFAANQEGRFVFIQNGQLIDGSEADESSPTCILQGGHMTFDPNKTYALISYRSLDIPDESGQIELNFETHSTDPESYFDIYCFQATSGTDLNTAREGLKSVFELR